MEATQADPAQVIAERLANRSRDAVGGSGGVPAQLQEAYRRELGRGLVNQSVTVRCGKCDRRLEVFTVVSDGEGEVSLHGKLQRGDVVPMTANRSHRGSLWRVRCHPAKCGADYRVSHVRLQSAVRDQLRVGGGQLRLGVDIPA